MLSTHTGTLRSLARAQMAGMSLMLIVGFAGDSAAAAGELIQPPAGRIVSAVAPTGLLPPAEVTFPPAAAGSILSPDVIPQQA